MYSIFKSLADGLTLSDYDHWLIFDARLKDLIRAGRARRAPTLEVLHMPDEEWYVEPATGEIYVYVKPDDKVLPKWERVDVFKNAEEANTSKIGLDAIPVGRMDSTRVKSIKAMLDMLIRQEEIETVDVGPSSALTAQWGDRETRYRDCKTGMVYRLLEALSDGENRWERVLPTHRKVGVQ